MNQNQLLAALGEYANAHEHGHCEDDDCHCEDKHCHNDDEHKSADLPVLDPEAVWPIIYDISENNTPALGAIFNGMENYMESHPAFKKDLPVFMKEKINEVKNESLSFDDFAKKASTIIQVLPLVPSNDVISVYQYVIKRVQKEMETSQAIPLVLVDAFDNFLADMLDEETLVKLFNIVQTSEADGNGPSSIACFASISYDIIQAVPESLEFVNQTILKYIKGTDLQKMSGLLLLEYHSMIMSEIGSPELFDPIQASILPLLHSENEIIAKRASHAARELVRSECLRNVEFIEKIIALFDKFTTPYLIHHFCRLMTVIIHPNPEEEEEDADEDISIIQPILDFCNDVIKSQKPLSTKARILNIFASIAAADNMYVEESMDDIEALIDEIVETKDTSLLPMVNNFIGVLVEMNYDNSIERAAALVPVLVPSIFDEKTGTIKERIYIAFTLSQMLKYSVSLSKEDVSKIITFALESMNENGTNASRMESLTLICVNLRREITQQQAKLVFDKLSEITKETTDRDISDYTLYAIKKIIKVHPFAEVASIAALIMSGELKLLNGSLPHLFHPVQQTMFSFLEAYIPQNTEAAKAICAQLIDWLGETPFGAISALITPIDRAFELSLMTDDLVANLLKVVTVMFKQLDENDAEEVTAVISILSHIWNYDQKLLTPVDEYLQHIEQLVAKAVEHNHDDEEEEESCGCGGHGGFNILEALPIISKFVFDIYLGSEELEVNEELFMPMIDTLPYPDPSLDEILESLIALVERDQFQSLQYAIMSKFADILLMKKSELQDFDIDAETMKNMKKSLKATLKAKPALAKKLSQNYQGSRAVLNRFNALIR